MKGGQVLEGRKSLIATINYNIWVVNKQKALILRLNTAKLTLHYLRELLEYDKTEANGKGEDYDPTLRVLDDLIELSELCITAYNKRQESYGELDSINNFLMGRVVGLCLKHDLLKSNFTTLEMSDLLDEKEEETEGD